MAIAIVIAIVAMYNGLVRRRDRVDETGAQIGAQLKRLRDLVPNLANAVKGYQGFEQKVLTDVTEARARAIAASARRPREQAAAENVLSAALLSLFAVIVNHPDLKAGQNVLALQEQVATTEYQVSGSRDAYNAPVRFTTRRSSRSRPFRWPA